MSSAGAEWPEATTSASTLSRPSVAMSWSAAVLSLIEIIKVASVCSVIGVPSGQSCRMPLG